MDKGINMQEKRSKIWVFKYNQKICSYHDFVVNANDKIGD